MRSRRSEFRPWRQHDGQTASSHRGAPAGPQSSARDRPGSARRRGQDPIRHRLAKLLRRQEGRAVTRSADGTPVPKFVSAASPTCLQTSPIPTWTSCWIFRSRSVIDPLRVARQADNQHCDGFELKAYTAELPGPSSGGV